MEIIPKCHPVNELTGIANLSQDGNWLLALISAIKTFRLEWLRDESRFVWLEKTNTKDIYVCPIKTKGKCRGNFAMKCAPEVEGITVKDTDKPGNVYDYFT